MPLLRRLRFRYTSTNREGKEPLTGHQQSFFDSYDYIRIWLPQVLRDDNVPLSLDLEMEESLFISGVRSFIEKEIVLDSHAFLNYGSTYIHNALKRLLMFISENFKGRMG